MAVAILVASISVSIIDIALVVVAARFVDMTAFVGEATNPTGLAHTDDIAATIITVTAVRLGAPTCCT